VDEVRVRAGGDDVLAIEMVAITVVVEVYAGVEGAIGDC
jgi:hypothetical protein